MLEKTENTGYVVVGCRVGEQQEEDKHQTDEVNKDDKDKVNLVVHKEVDPPNAEAMTVEEMAKKFFECMCSYSE